MLPKHRLDGSYLLRVRPANREGIISDVGQRREQPTHTHVGPWRGAKPVKKLNPAWAATAVAAAVAAAVAVAVALTIVTMTARATAAGTVTNHQSKAVRWLTDHPFLQMAHNADNVEHPKGGRSILTGMHACMAG